MSNGLSSQSHFSSFISKLSTQDLKANEINEFVDSILKKPTEPDKEALKDFIASTNKILRDNTSLDTESKKNIVQALVKYINHSINPPKPKSLPISNENILSRLKKEINQFVSGKTEMNPIRRLGRGKNGKGEPDPKNIEATEKRMSQSNGRDKGRDKI